MDRRFDPARASDPARDRGRKPRQPDYEAIENLDTAAGIEAVREILDEPSPVLAEFFHQAQAYRDRVFSKVTKVKRLRIEDRAVKERMGYVAVSFLGDRARHSLSPPRDPKAKPSRLVRLSPETAVKQLINHRDLGVDDCRRLPDIIDDGNLHGLDDLHLAFFRFFDDYWRRAVVKRTSKNEIYLVSYHRAQPTQVPAELRNDTQRTLPLERVAHGGARNNPT